MTSENAEEVTEPPVFVSSISEFATAAIPVSSPLASMIALTRRTCSPQGVPDARSLTEGAGSNAA
ncbi:MAG TPA: hypothetical protein VGB83_09015 [Actinomycetota bacterium]